MLRFSIVIPVYNGASYIKEAIRSCITQSVLPAQVIVVDDASTDETCKIVSSFSHPIVEYYRNPKKSGPSYSRNFGMRQVRAEWILFLDADDIFHPEKIEIVRNLVLSNESVRALGHSFTIGGLARIDKDHLPPLRFIAQGQVLRSNPVVTPALGVRADNDVLFNESMSYAEDHDFILRTAGRFGLWYVNLPLCSLQRVPLTAGGLSADRWKMRKGEIRMYIDHSKRHGRYLQIPLLVLFSLLKHMRGFFRKPR